MNFTPLGETIFDDVFELNYNLFTEIGLKVNPQGYLQDEDSGIVIQYKEKYIKATVVPTEIYAGKTDIDKRNFMEGEESIGFIAQFIEDENELRERQRVVVKTHKGEYYSRYYYNAYLGFVECIFALSGTSVDLTNLDFPPVEVK